VFRGSEFRVQGGTGQRSACEEMRNSILPSVKHTIPFFLLTSMLDVGRSIFNAVSDSAAFTFVLFHFFTQSIMLQLACRAIVFDEGWSYVAKNAVPAKYGSSI
jgi:hypothetical protein